MDMVGHEHVSPKPEFIHIFCAVQFFQKITQSLEKKLKRYDTAGHAHELTFPAMALTISMTRSVVCSFIEELPAQKAGINSLQTE